MKRTILRICLYAYSENDIGTDVTASLDNGRLSVVRTDWGGTACDYAGDGEIESSLFFDPDQTAKLAESLQVAGSRRLLEKLRTRFGRYGSSAPTEIRRYCDKTGIVYTVQVYY